MDSGFLSPTCKLCTTSTEITRYLKDKRLRRKRNYFLNFLISLKAYDIWWLHFKVLTASLDKARENDSSKWFTAPLFPSPQHTHILTYQIKKGWRTTQEPWGDIFSLSGVMTCKEWVHSGCKWTVKWKKRASTVSSSNFRPWRAALILLKSFCAIHSKLQAPRALVQRPERSHYS